MYIKITEYKIRHGPTLWRISTSIKVMFEQFSLAFTVLEIFTFKMLWLWKCESRSRDTELAMLQFDGKHDFLSDGNSNVALPHTIYKIFTNQIKCYKFDLDNEGQGLEGEKTGLAPFDRKYLILCRWFFFDFSYPGTCVYAKNTYTVNHKNGSTCFVL